MSEEIIYKKENDLQYIQFKKLLQYGIKHAYTLKGENIDFSNDSQKMNSSYPNNSFEVEPVSELML